MIRKYTAYFLKLHFLSIHTLNGISLGLKNHHFFFLRVHWISHYAAHNRRFFHHFLEIIFAKFSQKVLPSWFRHVSLRMVLTRQPSDGTNRLAFGWYRRVSLWKLETIQPSDGMDTPASSDQVNSMHVLRCIQVNHPLCQLWASTSNTSHLTLTTS